MSTSLQPGGQTRGMLLSCNGPKPTGRHKWRPYAATGIVVELQGNDTYQADP